MEILLRFSDLTFQLRQPLSTLGDPLLTVNKLQVLSAMESQKMRDWTMLKKSLVSLKVDGI